MRYDYITYLIKSIKIWINVIDFSGLHWKIPDDWTFKIVEKFQKEKAKKRKNTQYYLVSGNNIEKRDLRHVGLYNVNRNSCSKYLIQYTKLPIDRNNITNILYSVYMCNMCVRVCVWGHIVVSSFVFFIIIHTMLV